MSEHHLGDLLSALLDGELSVTEEVVARRHLETCGLCTNELVEIETARTLVRGLPAVDPPFGLLERLGPSGPLSGVLGPSGPLSGVPGPSGPLSGMTVLGAGRLGLPRSSHRRRVGVAALAASAAAGVALLGLAPPREEPVSPSVARLVEAHATGASVEGDPVSRLAPLGVPVSLRR